MRTIIILAMHGAPPKDFPPQEMAEFFTLSGRLRREAGPRKTELLERYSMLEAKIRKWPRNEQNDPFFKASRDLAIALNQITGSEVIVGFNEFCCPELKEAIEEAARNRPERIVVVTPMMTRGGDHAEIEIPVILNSVQESYPQIKMLYAWPFTTNEIAKFLAEHISHFEDI